MELYMGAYIYNYASSPGAVVAVSQSEGDYIVSMALSPSEEALVCATSSQQLLLHILSSNDLTKARINELNVCQYWFHLWCVCLLFNSCIFCAGSVFIV